LHPMASALLCPIPLFALHFPFPHFDERMCDIKFLSDFRRFFMVAAGRYIKEPVPQVAFEE